ncbi:DUF3263 domain-containing protein [Pilimelia columellifera]|uniref:DUF3263 domain-containing protein n=1 Tax=Pilimelia columellifera subsp. columellifera TaxID=706583 RepID=A0ABN3NG08_9ACTN
MSPDLRATQPSGPAESSCPVEPPGPTELSGHADLSDRDVRILDFERKWWRHPGAKEQAIRDEFDISGIRYYQLLNRLLDDPRALAHDPVLVGRLRRLRAGRLRPRAADAALS